MQVVRQDGRLVGGAACGIADGNALLHSVAVLPSARCSGIGSALVSAILRQLVADGFGSVTSFVPAASVSSVAPAASFATVAPVASPQTGGDFLRRFGFLAISPDALPSAFVRAQAAAGGGSASVQAMRLDLRGGALVRPARRTDMPAALEIYNEAVAHSTATYDYEPRSLEAQFALFDQKMLDGLGFFVACTPEGEVVGFSTYGLYRTRPGWRFASEHSVYVAASARGKGVGLALLPPVMWHARRKGFHTMIGVVDASNDASLRMHRRAGFTDVGTIREGGYKFDRWLDVAFLQAIL